MSEQGKTYHVGYEWKRGDFKYTVLDRLLDVVLVQVNLIDGAFVSYEVAIVRWCKERELGSRLIPAGEYYPPSEEWGKRGWSYSDLEIARERFRATTKSRTKPQDTPSFVGQSA